jgi:carboxypeptidase C (cathepsin A)
MGDEEIEAMHQRLRDEIKRAVVIGGQGRATYREIMGFLAKVNLAPSEEGMSDSISEILGKDFKLVIKDEDLGVQCTEILKALDDASFTNEKFLFVKREEGGFNIEAVKELQE